MKLSTNQIKASFYFDQSKYLAIDTDNIFFIVIDSKNITFTVIINFDTCTELIDNSDHYLPSFLSMREDVKNIFTRTL